MRRGKIRGWKCDVAKYEVSYRAASVTLEQHCVIAISLQTCASRLQPVIQSGLTTYTMTRIVKTVSSTKLLSVYKHSSASDTATGLI